MNKLLRKSVTFIAATALSYGIFCIPVVHNAQIFNTSITIEAKEIKTGNVGDKFSEACGDNAWLYFTVVDESKKTAAISGCWTQQSGLYLTLPNTVKTSGGTYKIVGIADSAFEGQTNIKGIYGGKNIDYIGNSAFYGCTVLEGLNIAKDASGQAHLSSIGNYAFCNCPKLENYALGDAKKIGDYAFYNCKKFNSIYLSNTESIGINAFENCSYVEYIDLRETKITSIPDYCFSSCFGAKYIKLPETLQKIGNGAFSYCQNFEKIYIPENTTQIGYSAFKCDTKLETVMLPEGITTIGDSAFNCCDSMKYFVCKNPNATFGEYSVGYSFNKKYNNFIIWGKEGSAKQYATANGFTYHNVSEAASIAKNNYKNYMWKIGNTSTSLADANGNYLIIDEHKPYDVKKASEKKFNGSCYGMAAISSLIKNGDLSVKTFSKGLVDKISDINTSNLTDYMKSFINTCWSACNAYYGCDYSLRDDGLFTDKEMLSYIEYMTYGADVGVLSYCTNSSDNAPGHAIVCFGLEYKEDASDQSSLNWNNSKVNPNARILVYDGNISSFTPARCFYINTKTGAWKHGNSGFYSYYDSDNNLKSTFKASEECKYAGYFLINHTASKMFNIDIEDL